MSLGHSDNCFSKIISYFLSIIIGVAAGLLFTQHFLYGRILFWISLAVAFTVWVLIFIFRRIAHADAHRHGSSYRELLLINFGLFGTSLVGLAVADTHTTLHAVLFGINVALLSFVLMYDIFYKKTRRTED